MTYELKRLAIFCLAALGLSVVASAAEVAAADASAATAVISLDGQWALATDPQNVGREEQWFNKPTAEAKAAKVPWIIQEQFPAYHGVAWYWRDFTPPKNPHAQGRTLLRFWQVDYLADVWLNGVHVGGHEGGEGVFVLDVTDTIKPGEKNSLAVRVLNPTNDRIDGIALGEVPRTCKVVPFYAGALYNCGGIVDSVELILAPPVRLTDLHLCPDPKTGAIHVRAIARNALPQAVRAHFEFTVAPAASGETLNVAGMDRDLPPGDTPVEAVLQVNGRRLWELNDPYLYRVTARVRQEGATSLDELSSRCGFRDFRFENGYFRLNGKRIFVKCSHTATHYPIGQHWPHDPDLARRDLLNVKAMGFNAIRFFCSVPARYQLDLCDEIGLMIYEESYAGWFLQPSPKMAERFDREVSDMIGRDRNHPSVTMWGLLNEMSEGPVFRHAVEMLPLVRSLDKTRLVMLNSGLFQFVSGGNSGLGEISLWKGEDATEPNITFNGTKAPIDTLGIVWKPGQLALHPGAKGEFAVLRWTAPAAGDYALSAKCTGIAQHATTDVHVLHQGKSLFDSFINVQGQGNECSLEKTVSAKAGDTIDFAVGRGDGSHGGDCTALAVTLRKGTDAGSDAARDFSAESNPQGPWTYGCFRDGDVPDASTFQKFPMKSERKAIQALGALSNPGSTVWEDVVSDQHPYKRVPHTAAIIRELRTVADRGKPVWLSEYGIGSGVDFARITRHFEQLGAEQCEDAQWYRQRLDEFLVDWKRFHLDDTFASPEDFLAQCLAKMGRQRLLGLNAIRANPNVVGHSVTGTVDQANTGEGLCTAFRELKPGTVDAMFDGWYPLRWCLFVEPVNVYCKTPVHLEAVLANEDALKPGEYPARFQVVGPDGKRVFDRTQTVTIPDPHATLEPPFAISVFAEDVVIDGPPGKYRFLATFERGAAAAGGAIEFYAADPAAMPAVEQEIVLWGDDAELAQWLKEHGIRTRPFSAASQQRQVILASSGAPAPGGAAVFRELAQRIARGDAVVFLSSALFATEKQRTAWAPLAKKGDVVAMHAWLYHKDEWSKDHPIFDGLPCGGLMDYTFYREIIPDHAWIDQDAPAEAVAGAINTSQGYGTGLMVSVNSLGAGRFILNTLRIRENLGNHPVAERLLRNMLRCGARDVGQPLAELPADFDQQLKSMGY